MNAPVRIDDYALADRYALERGRVFLTGTQAIVQILLDQSRRDRVAGLDTAGFVSGYRVAIARAPMDIRGYGPVKEEAAAAVRARVEDLVSQKGAEDQSTLVPVA